MQINNGVCPNCNQETLEKIHLYKNKVDKCNKCGGIWFDQDELRKVKDNKDKFLKWLDIDLWEKKDKFKVFSSDKLCPVCKTNLHEINYSNSNIKIDICNSCKGIWLDKGEFKKIISHLKNVINTETLSKYFKHAFEEAKEIFSGQEGLSPEIEDFLIVTKLLQYRFLSQYPIIRELIIKLPY